MSRVLKEGKNQVTNSYANHKGWSRGVDVVKYKSQIDYIVAHTEGKVIKVVDYMVGTNGKLDRESMGYGCYVMILHKNKYQNKHVVTLYAHLANVDSKIKEGATVEKGQVLGLCGNTGNSFGDHLHFEVRLVSEEPNSSNLHDTSKFEWIDPTPYLDADLPKDEQKLFRVQVGSFRVYSNAANRAKELIKKGFDACLKLYDGNYRVQVGAYSNKANADNMQKKIKAAGYTCYVTTESGVDVELK